MADSDKTEHVPESIMERFSMRTLSETELTNVARHLTGCPDCQALLVSTLRRQREAGDLSFTLAPEFWIRHEHLDYEQVLEYALHKLDATDRELIDVHLTVCPTCKEDVRSFLAFREQIAPELKVSYSPIGQAPIREQLSWVGWWRSLAWKPVYSAAFVLLGIALLIGAALLLNRRAENQQAQHSPTPQVTPGSTPDDRAANLPSPNESPSEKPNNAEAVVVLNDRSGTITVYNTGNVTGLDNVSVPTRNEVAQALLSGKIDRPLVLRELRGEGSALRGSDRGQPFKLIAPGRTVIISNRPTFKWEKVLGASAYTVYVTDAKGQIVASSDRLAADHREWHVSKPLNRGEIFAWTVTAVVDGKEITSPGPSVPERKFQVLSTGNLQQLNNIKKSRSLLALGLFYAKVGMIAEADFHLQNLLRQNPNSSQARKLVTEVRSMQSR